MTKRDNNGGSNIVELLGLLVATVGLFVTLSDKWQPNKVNTRPPVEQRERYEPPRQSYPYYGGKRSSPGQERAKAYKRQDRLPHG